MPKADIRLRTSPAARIANDTKQMAYEGKAAIIEHDLCRYMYSYSYILWHMWKRPGVLVGVYLQ